VCLTLRNAVAVLDHQGGVPPAPGYTRTRHHIGRLDPGDWWFPGPDLLPHTVTGIHRRDGRIVMIDQFGIGYSYPADAVLLTAVPDPRILAGARPGRHEDVDTRDPEPIP